MTLRTPHGVKTQAASALPAPSRACQRRLVSRFDQPVHGLGHLEAVADLLSLLGGVPVRLDLVAGRLVQAG